jgi:hypothetical protein
MSDLERLAREAGMSQLAGTTFSGCAMTPEILAKFYTLVRNEALEEAAQECERDYAATTDLSYTPYTSAWVIRSMKKEAP